MKAVRRCFGLFHVAIAAAVAVQALASETYDAELSSAVWLVLNWLMAVAVVTAGAFSYMRWRGRDSSAAGNWISPRALLTACAVLLVLYFEQWSSEFGIGTAELSSFRRSMWLFIDTLFVLVNATAGVLLLRGQ
ncbi:MAG: hypothetical protein OXG04_04430 [Acidobacteria bacterium]|nr:hypothetical protein [Acidobacteriota bacterium]